MNFGKTGFVPVFFRSKWHVLRVFLLSLRNPCHLFNMLACAVYGCLHVFMLRMLFVKAVWGLKFFIVRSIIYDPPGTGNPVDQLSVPGDHEESIMSFCNVAPLSTRWPFQMIALLCTPAECVDWLTLAG